MQPELKMPCETKERLRQQYEEASQLFSDARMALRQITSPRDYDLFKNEADLALARVQEADAAFKKHIAEHGC